MRATDLEKGDRVEQIRSRKGVVVARQPGVVRKVGKRGVQVAFDNGHTVWVAADASLRLLEAHEARRERRKQMNKPLTHRPLAHVVVAAPEPTPAAEPDVSVASIGTVDSRETKLDRPYKRWTRGMHMNAAGVCIARTGEGAHDMYAYLLVEEVDGSLVWRTSARRDRKSLAWEPSGARKRPKNVDATDGAGVYLLLSSVNDLPEVLGEPLRGLLETAYLEMLDEVQKERAKSRRTESAALATELADALEEDDELRELLKGYLAKKGAK